MIKELRQLLDQLQVSGSREEVNGLVDIFFASLASGDADRGSLETAIKVLNYDIAASGDEVSLQSSFKLLDVVLSIAEREQCDEQLPLVLAEELLECHTIESCKLVFQYLERHVDRLTDAISGSRGKGLVLLRLCNELLRRLSKTEDAVFCGRILIFLSKSFPLNEKSALNSKGDFHVENVTTYDKSIGQNGEVMQLDIFNDEDKALAAKKAEVDQFYPLFWSIQEDLSNPIRLMETLGKFEIFQRSVKTVLDKFRSHDEADQQSGAVPKDPPNKKRKRDDDDDDDVKRYFSPKFLTSRNLFDLELADVSFRRHVLVQIHIILDYLGLFTEKSRAKLPQSSSKTLLPDFVLKGEKEKWVNDTRVNIANTLSNSQHNGRLFLRTVQAALHRDRNWVTWKFEGCPSFERRSLGSAEFEEARASVSRKAAPLKPLQYPSGSSAMSKIWVDNSKTAAEDHNKWSVPAPEEFVNAIASNQIDIDSQLKPEDRDSALDAKASKTWRALRSAARKDLRYFKDVRYGELDEFFKARQSEIDRRNTTNESQSDPAIPTANGSNVKPDGDNYHETENFIVAEDLSSEQPDQKDSTESFEEGNTQEKRSSSPDDIQNLAKADKPATDQQDDDAMKGSSFGEAKSDKDDDGDCVAKHGEFSRLEANDPKVDAEIMETQPEVNNEPEEADG